MLVFVSSNDSLKSLKMEVEASTTIGKLMQKAYQEMKKGSDFEEDNEVYLANQDEDFDKGKTLEQCGVKNGDHLFIGKCKRVNVVVSYHGRSFSAETTPALMLKVLKKKVAEHFGMTDQEVADFQFLFNGVAIDDLKTMVGSLVNYSACNVSLVFAPKKDVNGFFDAPLDLLNNDLEEASYLSGKIEGIWGKVENGPDWPISIFWVLAKNDVKYYLRFDLTDYKQMAPTAQLWDVETNQPLAQNLWPNWSSRCLQVFRNWGTPCLYLPCDRLAFNGHTDWPLLHPSLVWKNSEDSIFKYLNEVYQILN